jgi:phosphinothricin acetyltransferase
MDAAGICDIYNYYVTETVISFEEVPVTTEQMEQRIRNITVQFPWFVSKESGVITGYAYAAPWRDRIAYRYSVEDSIYIRNGHQGRVLDSFF